MKKVYKVIYRNIALGGIYTEFSKDVPETYSTYTKAYEAMIEQGHKLEENIKKLCPTKLDVYRYETVIPELNNTPAMKAVVVQKNIVSFTSSPVAYLQIIEAEV